MKDVKQKAKDDPFGHVHGSGDGHEMSDQPAQSSRYGAPNGDGYGLPYVFAGTLHDASLMDRPGGRTRQNRDTQGHLS